MAARILAQRLQGGRGAGAPPGCIFA